MKLKSLFLIPFLLAPALAFSAALPVIVGVFAITEVYTVQFHKKYEVVDSETSQGQARMDALRIQGYHCGATDTAKYVCSKTLKDFANPPLELDERVREKWSGILMSLREPSVAPKLSLSGRTFQQWEVQQKAYLQPGSSPSPMVFSKVVYTRDLEFLRFYLGDIRQSEFHFVVRDSVQLSLIDSISIENGPIRDHFDVTIFVQRLK